MNWSKAFKNWLQRLRRGRGVREDFVNGPMRKFLHMIVNTRETEYSCDQVYELLDQYAEMVARGEDVSRLMPLVKHHIEMCQDCREELEALLRIMQVSPA